MGGKAHVAVLMGGWSSEREVSLRSGRACAKALAGAGYRVTELDVTHKVTEDLLRLKPDVAFNALHGPFGEDGRIQGVLEYLEVPYTHSGVLASALAMDKDKAKAVVARRGLPLAEHVLASRFDVASSHPMAPPYVVKPLLEGSSFGVVIVREGANAPPAEVGAPDWPYGDTVMVERYVPGRELTCAVMGEEVFGVIDIVPTGGAFYDYDAKYRPGGSVHILPAKIKPNIYHAAQTITLEAHRALGCRGVSRSDFRYDEANDELIWLEVNTQPGMTETSLVPELAAHAGYDFPALVSWLVEDASCCR